MTKIEWNKSRFRTEEGSKFTPNAERIWRARWDLNPRPLALRRGSSAGFREEAISPLNVIIRARLRARTVQFYETHRTPEQARSCSDLREAMWFSDHDAVEREASGRLDAH